MSFYSELRRRNVFRVAILYLGGVWLVLQVADVVLPVVGAPPWTMLALIIAVSLGFPVAILLAWVFAITPEGIRATETGDALEPVRFMGRKLDFVIIAVLLLAVGVLVADDFVETESIWEQSIAILPFDYIGEPDDSHFASGIHEELVSALTNIGELRVIGSSSVRSYADDRPPLAEIADALSVDVIVTGNVRYAAGHVRVTVRLIDGATEAQLWADAYDREFSAANMFAMQANIASSIATKLEIQLSRGDAEHLSTVLTNNDDALSFYYGGLRYENTPGNHALRIVQYRSAVDADPNFAVGWAKLADALMDRARFVLDHEEHEALVSEARAAAQRAMDIDDMRAESHIAMAQVYRLDGHFDAAFAEYAIAQDLAPSNAWIYASRAGALRDRGDYDAAIEQYEIFQSLEPRDGGGYTQQGEVYARLRKYELAEEAFATILRMYPDDEGANPRMIFLQEAEGDLEGMRAALAHETQFKTIFDRHWRLEFYERDLAGALAVIEEWVKVEEEDTFDAHGWTLLFLADSPDEAKRFFERNRDHMLEGLSELSDDPQHPDYREYLEQTLFLARTLGHLGATEDARAQIDAVADDPLIRVLSGTPEQGLHLGLIWALIAADEHERAIDELDVYLSSPNWWSLEGLELDPRFEPLTHHPRYADLVEKYART